jgi:hypothetical protein
MVRKHQTRNLEILRCAIAHRNSMLTHRSGMTRRYSAASHFFTMGHAGSGGPNASSPEIFVSTL